MAADGIAILFCRFKNKKNQNYVTFQRHQQVCGEQEWRTCQETEVGRRREKAEAGSQPGQLFLLVSGMSAEPTSSHCREALEKPSACRCQWAHGDTQMQGDRYRGCALVAMRKEEKYSLSNKIIFYLGNTIIYRTE